MLSQFLKLQKKSVTCDQHGQIYGGSGYTRHLVWQGGGVQFCQLDSKQYPIHLIHIKSRNLHQTFYNMIFLELSLLRCSSSVPGVVAHKIKTSYTRKKILNPENYDFLICLYSKLMNILNNIEIYYQYSYLYVYRSENQTNFLFLFCCYLLQSHTRYMTNH